MYARGMSTRQIQVYGLENSPDLVSAVTDAVLEEAAEWQNRPLERLYPLVFLDALRVKLRDEGTVRNKAVYLALGVRLDGTNAVLGLWIEQTEGAKFWLRVMNELKDRGVEDILIAVVDGLKGFPDAIAAVLPQTQVQANGLLSQQSAMGIWHRRSGAQRARRRRPQGSPGRRRSAERGHAAAPRRPRREASELREWLAAGGAA